jgi:hypothetical protein
VFTRKTIPFIVGSILLVAVAFLFLTRALDWAYVSDLYKDEPTVVFVPPQQPLPEIKLDVAVSLNEQQYAELLKVSQQVSEQHPKIDVKITNYFEEQLSYMEWERRARLGELGDIQLVPNEWVVPLAIQGLYQPVDRLMNNEVLSDQLPSIVDALKWNGYMWAVPYESNPYLVFVHNEAAELLEQGGERVHKGEAEADNEAEVDNEVEVEDDAVQGEPIVSGMMPRLNFITDIQAGQSSNEATNVVGTEEELDPIASNDVTSSTATTSTSTVLADWRFEHWVQLYDQLTDFSGALLNVDFEHVESILSLLSLWHEAGDYYMDVTGVEGQQLEMLHYLMDNAEKVQISVESSESANAKLPLLYMVTAREYSEHWQFIMRYYMPTQVLAPLPWVNGKSYMLSASALGAQKNEAAMQWLEIVNRFQPQGTLSHRKLHAMTSSNRVQSLLGMQFQQKLGNRQLFRVDRQWVSYYEQLQQRWKQEDTLQQKLTIFLQDTQ